MAKVNISSDISAYIAREAKETLDLSFKAFADRSLARTQRSEIQNEFASALISLVVDAGKMQKPHLGPTPEEALTALRGRKRRTPSRQMHHSPEMRALATRPFRTIDAGGVHIAEDSQLQLFFPPFVDQWAAGYGSGDFTFAGPSADARTGEFGFWQAAAGGSSVWSGAGVWVQFIPDRPLIQIRSVAPYHFEWFDHSKDGYTAHNDAGFGIYVLSWNMRGADMRLEQDYRYSVWSDGTGWWETHSDSGDDTAYVYTHNPPYFEAEPDRIYRACIWCFGSCDAGRLAVAEGDISAYTDFIVIGEQ